MSYLKTPFVIIPIFLNVILLVGIPYFDANPPLKSLYPVLGLALVFPWVLYFVIAAVLNSVAKQTGREVQRAEDGDFV